MSKVIIIMGSKKDLDWSKRIFNALNRFGIKSVLRIVSAHKTPIRCTEIIKEYEDENPVFITVAGRSNALSGFIDAQTVYPVIACPPYSEKFAGSDIYSSLSMPTGVAPMVVLEPENAALAAAKILGLVDKKIQEDIKQYQAEIKQEIEEADKEVRSYV